MTGAAAQSNLAIRPPFNPRRKIRDEAVLFTNAGGPRMASGPILLLWSGKKCMNSLRSSLSIEPQQPDAKIFFSLSVDERDFS